MPNYARCNCSVSNMRFLPGFFAGEAVQHDIMRRRAHRPVRAVAWG